MGRDLGKEGCVLAFLYGKGMWFGVVWCGLDVVYNYMLW